MHKTPLHKKKRYSFFKKIKRKLLFLFRLNNQPVIKVYRGYGNSEKIIVFGHVLKLSPMGRKTYRRNWVVNIFSILRLFMVKPYACAKLMMEWEGNSFYSESQDDGFFKFEWKPLVIPAAGWHNIIVHLNEEKYSSQKITGEGQVHIPFALQYAFISDIDDTFCTASKLFLCIRLM